MTPIDKEKIKTEAIELINKFSLIGLQQRECIQCALIAVDEIIKICPYISKDACDTIEQLKAPDVQFISYWEEVKQEILNQLSRNKRNRILQIQE